MDDDLVLHRRKRLAFHTNGMRFTAMDARRAARAGREYYSVGGGFVLDEDEAGSSGSCDDSTPVPYPFTHAARSCWRAPGRPGCGSAS